MKNLNLATAAIVSVIVATGLAATVIIALSAGLLVANNQRDFQIASCERGNAAREALRTTATIVQGNLRAASRVHSGREVVIYARNIERLEAVKEENASIDCETAIPHPSLVP